MRIGLVSYECRNRYVQFNLEQAKRALRETEGKVDLLCFNEAYLQGFDSLCWDYEVDKNMAIDLNSETVSQLCRWSIEYNTAILTGYIEKDQEALFSSCMVISEGKVIHNYRRISKGWKEYDKTDNHYQEGSEVKTFNLKDKEIMISLCGDLWDYPERFKADGLLIWPVYLSISVDEWK